MRELFLCEGFSAYSSIAPRKRLDNRLQCLVNKYLSERNTTRRKKLYRKLVRVAKSKGYTFSKGVLTFE